LEREIGVFSATMENGGAVVHVPLPPVLLPVNEPVVAPVHEPVVVPPNPLLVPVVVPHHPAADDDAGEVGELPGALPGFDHADVDGPLGPFDDWDGGGHVHPGSPAVGHSTATSHNSSGGSSVADSSSTSDTDGDSYVDPVDAGLSDFEGSSVGSGGGAGIFAAEDGGGSEGGGSEDGHSDGGGEGDDPGHGGGGDGPLRI
jgi:hypothetical protein